MTLALNSAAAGYLAYLAAPGSKTRLLFGIASVLTLAAGPVTAILLGPTNASIQHLVDSGSKEAAEGEPDPCRRVIDLKKALRSENRRLVATVESQQ